MHMQTQAAMAAPQCGSDRAKGPVCMIEWCQGVHCNFACLVGKDMAGAWRHIRQSGPAGRAATCRRAQRQR